MGVFINKNIIQKIAIILMFLLILNFILPNFVSASSFLKEAGGTLLKPVIDLLVFLSDSVLNILQKTLIAPFNVVVEATSSVSGIGNSADIYTALKIALGVILVVVAVATILVSGGGAAAGWAAAAGTAAKLTVVGATVKTIGGGVLLATAGTASIIWGANDIAMDDNFDLPTIRYTPFEIFSGEVPILDINFLSPKESTVYQIRDEAQATSFVIDKYINENLNKNSARIETTDPEYKDFEKATVVEGVNLEDTLFKNMLLDSVTSYTVKENESKIYIEVTTISKTPDNSDYTQHFVYLLDKPLDEILSDEAIENAQFKEYQSSSSILQTTISIWYNTLRRFALVGLLSVIVYVGINIVISSASAEKKAKYKKMIIDWVAAVCILYVLHFLMVGIISIASEISNLFVASGSENILITLPNDTKVLERTVDASGKEIVKNQVIEKDEDTGKQYWSSSLTGYIRYMAGTSDQLDRIGYALMYVVIVIYTVMFTFMYLKRVLYIAFLTIIAPLIALTYPIDKIKDSKAQAFSLWLKEYIFNALLQPIHLIIYVMIVSTAMELIVDYPIYALVALGFMVPAEKFFRKMFGLEKTETVSALGAATGATLAISAIQKLGAGNKRHKKDKDNSKNENPTIREYNLPTTATSASTVGTSGSSSMSTPTYTPGSASGMNSGGGSATPGGSSGINLGGGSTTPSNLYRPNGSTKPPITSMGKIPATGFYAGLKAIGGKYSRELAKAKPLRALARGAGRVGGAITLGTAALPFGIASGSMGDTFKAVGASGLIGSGIGANVASDLFAEGSENREAFMSGARGEDEYIQQGVKDKKAIKKARELGMGPEVAGLSYKLVEELKKNKEYLYDDTKLRQVISSITSDNQIADVICEYIKAFR